MYDDDDRPERVYYVYAELTAGQQAASEEYQKSPHKVAEKDFIDHEYGSEEAADEAAIALSLIFRDVTFKTWSCYFSRMRAEDDGGDMCDERDHCEYRNGK